MVLTAGALVRVDSLERMQNALAPEGWDKPVRQGIEGIRNFRAATAARFVAEATESERPQDQEVASGASD
jgi:hypothetical protein